MRRTWLATEGITAAWSVVVCDTFSGGTESWRSFLGPCPVIYLSIYLSKELEVTTNHRRILPESTKSTSKDLSSVRLAATETNPLVTLA